MCSTAGLEGNSTELITAHQMGIYGRELTRAARAMDGEQDVSPSWHGAEIAEGVLTHSLGKAVRKPLASARGINNDHPGYSRSTNIQ